MVVVVVVVVLAEGFGKRGDVRRAWWLLGSKGRASAAYNMTGDVPLTCDVPSSSREPRASPRVVWSHTGCTGVRGAAQRHMCH